MEFSMEGEFKADCASEKKTLKLSWSVSHIARVNLIPSESESQSHQWITMFTPFINSEKVLVGTTPPTPSGGLLW